MRIALLSFADMENYGDMLFSFVMRHEINKRLPNAEFRFFTPTQFMIDNEQFCAYSRENVSAFDPHCIILAGGEVVHRYDEILWLPLPRYTNYGKPFDIVFDWLDIPNLFKVWFSVGVLAVDGWNKSVFTDDIDKLDYCGVRGILSKKYIEPGWMKPVQKIKIVPDLGYLFIRYFEETTINTFEQRLFGKSLNEKCGIQLDKSQYIVFNVNFTSINDDKKEMVKQNLIKFSKEHHIQIIIMSIVKSYHDEKDLSFFTGDNIHIVNGLSLNEQGWILCNARFYIGSSLHCAITTLSTGKPAAIIHNDYLTKLQDMFGHLMMSEYLSTNWNDFDMLLEKLWTFKDFEHINTFVKFVTTVLDESIDELCTLMREKVEPNKLSTEEPLVTIVCVTYNQENFIRDALESFVTQKTNFPFQAIIADDCSTDKTPDIIREYEQQYPDIIKPIYRSQNLGAMNNAIDMLSRVHSKYVISNEGDDYFTDSQKLQKQVYFLEAHPECSICFHPIEIIFEDNSQPVELFPSPEYRFNKTLLALGDILKHNFIQTNSCMYRWRFVDENIQDVFPKGILPGDYYIHLLHAQVGRIGFIDDAMAVYRRHSGGIWWDSAFDVEKLHLKYGVEEIAFYDAVYKHITPEPDQYSVTTLVPTFNYLLNIFIKHEKRHEIETVCSRFPNLFTGVFFDKLRQIADMPQQIETLKRSVSYRLSQKLMRNRIFRFFYGIAKKTGKIILHRS